MVTGLHFKIYKWERRSDKKGVVMGGGTNHKVYSPRSKTFINYPAKIRSVCSRSQLEGLPLITSKGMGEYINLIFFPL